MIHVLNNLPKECDVILNGLENCPMATGNNALTIDFIREKLNHRAKKLKRFQYKQSKQHARDVESMATNLAIRDVLKMKLKEKKMMRK